MRRVPEAKAAVGRGTLPRGRPAGEGTKQTIAVGAARQVVIAYAPALAHGGRHAGAADERPTAPVQPAPRVGPVRPGQPSALVGPVGHVVASSGPRIAVAGIAVPTGAHLRLRAPARKAPWGLTHDATAAREDAGVARIHVVGCRTAAEAGAKDEGDLKEGAGPGAGTTGVETEHPSACCDWFRHRTFDTAWRSLSTHPAS